MGIKIINGKAHCINCEKAVSLNEKVIINYCPHCGSPLNLKSASENESKELKNKLALLYEMQDDLGTNETAQDLLERFIQDIEENSGI